MILDKKDYSKLIGLCGFPSHVSCFLIIFAIGLLGVPLTSLIKTLHCLLVPKYPYCIINHKCREGCALDIEREQLITWWGEGKEKERGLIIQWSLVHRSHWKHLYNSILFVSLLNPCKQQLR